VSARNRAQSAARAAVTKLPGGEPFGISHAGIAFACGAAEICEAGAGELIKNSDTHATVAHRASQRNPQIVVSRESDRSEKGHPPCPRARVAVSREPSADPGSPPRREAPPTPG
jgi:hypothetical protein